MGDADEPQHVLEGEEPGEDVLRQAELHPVARLHRRHALEHHRQHRSDDGDEQRHVEGLPGGRVGLEDDAPQPRTPGGLGGLEEGHRLRLPRAQ